MKRPVIALLLTLAGTLAAAFGAAAAEPSNEITAENVIRLMNEYRAEGGLPPLRGESRLALAAGDRMRHMEDEGYWAHESPDGLTPFVWVRSREYNFQVAGENLASGFETARLLVQSWMESPGHRANIMSEDYQDCGIAIIDGATTGPATGKSIVVLFGKQKQTIQTVIARGLRQ
jgi:uncharacterized protein YkwD